MDFAAAEADGRALSPLDAVDEALAVAGTARVDEPALTPGSVFTLREREVLRLVAQGHSDREIGDSLSISPRTAMRHVANIYLKLDLSSRAAAAEFAFRHDLV